MKGSCVHDQGNPPRGEGFWYRLVIYHDSKTYMLFNVFITCLCLISSYFYASLVGFRYSAAGEVDVNYRTPTMIFEILFAIHMITQFFVEYKVDGEAPVADPFKIANNYWNNSLPLDLLCLLPLEYIKLKRDRHLLFFLIKMLRLPKGL